MKKLYILFLLISTFCTAQTLNFTINTAVDNGVSITEVLIDGTDTYILTVLHPGNEELDNLGGGDLVFYLSAIDPLEPYELSITKNGNAINFTLLGIDYDTLGTGSISVQNQDDEEISTNTEYVVGSGAIVLTNTTNATDILSFKIRPTGVLDLNNFGFHNINVDVGGTLSTSEIKNESFLSYYPNPVNDLLNITAKHTMTQIRVFNMLGQIVMTEMPNTTIKNLDVAQLPYGAYFVEVTIGNTINTVRIIKQ